MQQLGKNKMVDLKPIMTCEWTKYSNERGEMRKGDKNEINLSYREEIG
jgi:hypothetical protein